jgi:hypothetical protein
MTDRSEPDLRLETALAALAPAVEFPPTPDLASSVGEVLLVPQRVFWSPQRSFSRGLLAGMASVILVVGTVGAVGIGTGAIQIRFADGTPLPSISANPTRGLGQRVTLEKADAAIAWPINVPYNSELGPPDAIYLNAFPSGGTVSLVWGDREGYPAGDDGIGIVVTEFQANLAAGSFEKMVDAGTDVTRVTVNGQPGWWVEGGYHAFYYRDQTGTVVNTSVRLAGNTLFWEQGIVLRVEGAPDLDAALRVAESLE